MRVRRQRVARAAVMSGIITAALVASGVAGGNPASASGTCGTPATGHCYAVAQLGVSAGHTPWYASAVGLDLEVDCLAVANDSTEGATWELWLSTNDTDPNSTTESPYWLEGGYLAGSATGNTGFQYFWADSRPGGGYNAHFAGWATAYQYENLTFTWQGGSNWNVY